MVASISMSAFADEKEYYDFDTISDKVKVVELKGNIGDEFDVGNGVKARIISAEEAEDMHRKAAELEAAEAILNEDLISEENNLMVTSERDSVNNLMSTSSGWNTTLSASDHIRNCEWNLKMTNSYHYWKWTITNTQSSSNYLYMAVCEDDYSEDPNMNTALTTIIQVHGGTNYYLYSTNAWDAGTYRARIQSSNDITGTSSCIRATSYSDLGIN